ncbi:MAG: phosphodiesterase [Comamonadaceae bacterium CG_4_9_14_0_8_um_filter_57_21]|nr:MAG: phosphodiesterase [Comamonadaceae bacterium CG_4_10_14_0_8_um_filter_57_29]PJC22801.1 MAG: phosphodiesterase [Comamonadaceae bacterium CG_4_9_14_0_8_um_filter_57_21]
MRPDIKTEDEYEDLLGQWSDLESGLAVVLRHPNSTQEFEARIYQYDRWMQDLIQRNTDLALYLLFQLAAQSRAGYSTSHALMCAVLCHLLVPGFALPQNERNSLVRAALTMNIAMTAMQDELATQRDKPSPQQQATIAAHADLSATLLSQLGIHNELWLDTVILHHHEAWPQADLQSLMPAQRLAHVLHVVDRYSAMISPRQSREGRSAAESANSILHGNNTQDNPVGHALLHIVGLCPPGTFVQLSSDEVAVVLRRSAHPNQPDVVIVLDSKRRGVRPPVLQHMAEVGSEILGFVPASAIQERVNHHVILQLGMQ